MTKLLYLITVLSLFVSCKKDSTSRNGEGEVLLRKFVLLNSATNDTDYIYNFSYDDLNRCTTIDIFDSNFGGQYTYTNFYNGNDSVIQHTEFLGQDSAKDFFTYDVSGFLIKDSILEYPEFLIYNYTHTGNRVAGTLHTLTGYLLRSVHTINSDAAGNITNEIDSSFQISQFTGLEELDARIENVITYDNAPNPFYRIFPGKSIIMMYENWNELPMFHLFKGKNNILTQKRTVDLGTYRAFHDKYIYMYNTNGYPSSVIYTDIEYGGTYKGFYYY
jgi:hypothetical protein